MSFDILNNIDKKVHFIGIGGISMSGLAEILLYRGYKVSGSDRNKSHLTEKLKTMGAEIYYGHKAENAKDAGLIIYTAAVSYDNPELVYGKENGIKTVDRAEFLGELMKGHKYSVAISGTHGKTTTTSMLSMIVLKAEKDPTILVGGELDAIGGNVRAGSSEYFIAEACEYKASFLKFFPYIGVILNIEEDHLDFYKDINDIENTFMKFSKLIPDDGYLIGSFEDKRFMKIYNQAKCNKLSFGISGGDLKATDISYDDKGCPSFNVLLK
ncbi:MAG: Mur ligase domain-containing protein, partial [Clostridiaceae bacterium]